MTKMAYNRKYKRLRNKYRKQLTKQAKEAAPWDFGFPLEMFVTYLRFMRDYYKEGLNVADESEGTDSRLHTLNMALQLYEAWDKCFDNWYKLVKADEVECYKQGGWYAPAEAEPSAILDGQNYVMMTRLQTKQANDEMFNYYYRKNREDFFKFLAEHMEEWWD